MQADEIAPCKSSASVTYHHQLWSFPPCCCRKQADLLTTWSARAPAQRLTGSTDGCSPCRGSRAPFSNLITRLLVPAALNLHGSLPTFSSLFFLQSERTDKPSGTQDLIVDGWPAARIPSPHNCFGPRCIKQTGFTRQHRTSRILPRAQGSSMFLSLPTSTVVSNHPLEILRPNKCPACPRPHKKKKKEASPNKPMSICP